MQTKVPCAYLQGTFFNTIPSSFAGLTELPDQFVAGILQESLNALRTRNDGSTPPIAPSRVPFFLRSIDLLNLPFQFFMCWFFASSGLQQASYQIRTGLQGLPYGVSFLAPCSPVLIQ